MWLRCRKQLQTANLVTLGSRDPPKNPVSDNHLDYYLDEFTFGFNRWHSRARGLLFYRSPVGSAGAQVAQVAQIPLMPYHQIVDREPKKSPLRKVKWARLFVKSSWLQTKWER